MSNGASSHSTQLKEKQQVFSCGSGLRVSRLQLALRQSGGNWLYLILRPTDPTVIFGMVSLVMGVIVWEWVKSGILTSLDIFGWNRVIASLPLDFFGGYLWIQWDTYFEV